MADAQDPTVERKRQMLVALQARVSTTDGSTITAARSSLGGLTPNGPLRKSIHSHVRHFQVQASKNVACEQALFWGSSGQGRRYGRRDDG